MNTIPDVVGKKLDEGRSILFSSLRDCFITINEIHSFKEKNFYNISDGIIVKQKYIDGNIILYVGFFNPPA